MSSSTHRSDRRSASRRSNKRRASSAAPSGDSATARVDDPCEGEDEIEEDADPTPDEHGAIRLAVLSRVTELRPGFRTWFDRLPPEVQGELDAIRQQWQAGQTGHQKRALARAIVAEMQARELPVSGVQGVEHWLGRAR